jgi:hypothetical protein
MNDETDPFDKLHAVAEQLSLPPLFEAAENALNKLLDGIFAQIQFFGSCGDFDEVGALAKTASVVQSCQRAIGEHAKKPGVAIASTNSGAFAVAITSGALNNSYLSVTEGINTGLLKVGEVIQVKLPNGQEFTTNVVRGNRLQERGLIARFFVEEKVRATDKVSMTRVGAGLWQLEKTK